MNLYRFLLLLTVYFPLPLLSLVSIEHFFKPIELENLNSGIEGVNCVYVINLKERIEKWRETKLALEKYGIHSQRVDAINGWLLKEEEKKSLMEPYPVRLRGGQIGCILSHLSVLHDACNRGHQVIWICEDDIKIVDNPHVFTFFFKILSAIDPAWDILYTDSDSKASDGQVLYSLASDFRPDFPHECLEYYLQREYVYPHMIKIHQRFGAYSLLISERGIRKILQYFTTRPLWTAYDIDIHYIPEIQQYCLDKDWVTVNISKKSDTETHLELEAQSP